MPRGQMLVVLSTYCTEHCKPIIATGYNQDAAWAILDMKVIAHESVTGHVVVRTDYGAAMAKQHFPYPA